MISFHLLYGSVFVTLAANIISIKAKIRSLSVIRFRD